MNEQANKVLKRGGKRLLDWLADEMYKRGRWAKEIDRRTPGVKVRQWAKKNPQRLAQELGNLKFQSNSLEQSISDGVISNTGEWKALAIHRMNYANHLNNLKANRHHSQIRAELPDLESTIGKLDDILQRHIQFRPPEGIQWRGK